MEDFKMIFFVEMLNVDSKKLMEELLKEKC